MALDIKIVENFLPSEFCSEMVLFLESIKDWEKTHEADSWWNDRSLSDYTIYHNHSKKIGKKLLKIKQDVAEVIKKHYNLKEIYPDLLSISRWFPGMEQGPHADDMTNVYEEDNNWHKHRNYGSVIYLNDNFSGGNTYYPDYGLEVRPVPGTLVIHPATPDHLHGITKVEDAIRYTISSFWTKDIKFFNNWIAN